jgi:hypothetical protein
MSARIGLLLVSAAICGFASGCDAVFPCTGNCEGITVEQQPADVQIVVGDRYRLDMDDVWYFSAEDDGNRKRPQKASSVETSDSLVASVSYERESNVVTVWGRAVGESMITVSARTDHPEQGPGVFAVTFTARVIQ